MCKTKKLVLVSLISFLQFVSLQLQAKDKIFLRNSSFGISYNNGIYLANTSFITPNPYLTYRTKPSVFYGFGLNYYYQFTPHFALNIGYNANIVKNNDRYDLDFIRYNDELLGSKNQGLTSESNDHNEKAFHGVLFEDNEYRFMLISTHKLTNNLALEFAEGFYGSCSFKNYITSLNGPFWIYQQIINERKKFSVGLSAGFDLKYSFKHAGALKFKTIFNANLSKSLDQGTITILPGTAVESSSKYMINHSHIDFCIEYILPHISKKRR